ncbi:MAG TPA: NUDIX domain-containing protein [Phycisphaerales bacterium]|nr:NUDIX domain-containing protein [Phycisphaerales bacterium]
MNGPRPELPYRLACLCDIRDDAGRVLLLHRAKPPNEGLCSPIGGKLDMASGESPAECARREIAEEAGVEVPLDRLRLVGLISEAGYEGNGHWLLFYFRVLGAIPVRTGRMNEGMLEWHDPALLDGLPLPETDRRIIWPLVERIEPASPGGEPGFFSVHIDCTGPEMTWRVEQVIPGAR